MRLNSDTQPYLLLTLIALSGEFPSAQVSRPPGSEFYKKFIVTQMKREKMVRSIYRDSLRGLKSTSTAKRLPLTHDPAQFQRCLTGNTETNRPKSETPRRVRLHRMAEVLVTYLYGPKKFFKFSASLEEMLMAPPSLLVRRGYLEKLSATSHSLPNNNAVHIFRAGQREGVFKMGKQPNERKVTDDPRYHNTWRLLKKYRDVVWSLEVSVQQLQKEFKMEYGSTVEEFLESIYLAGADLGGTELEHHAQCVEKSNQMLRMVDSAVSLLRAHHKNGDQYYWLLYYTYLSPQKLKNLDEVLEQLQAHIQDISPRTYYRKRNEAVEALSSILWGYTAQDTLDLVEELLPPTTERCQSTSLVSAKKGGADGE